MSHHSSSDPVMEQVFKNFVRRGDNTQEDVDKLLNLGATGNFPEGKLTEHDEGEIQIALHEHKGKVIIDFGTPVKWVGLNPEQALDFGKAMVKQAKKIIRHNRP